MLDWLVIGGGIHGVHLAARLIEEAGVLSSKLRIVDPGEQLLHQWRTCAERTGMKYLRSPAVHHLDIDPWSLTRFAKKRKRRFSSLFKAPYQRPALHLFNAHCNAVINRYQLPKLHIRAEALKCEVDCSHVTVELGDGQQLRSHKVVLAVGSGGQPYLPPWVPRNDERIQHLFDLQRPMLSFTAEQSVAVVGGGISAGQTALRLRDEGHAVHLISRHPL